MLDLSDWLLLLFFTYNANYVTDQLKVTHQFHFFAQLIKTHSWSTVRIDRNELQFFFKHVLQRGWER
ncbi:phage integrase N-terminal SAM-like domain-containing protein [Photobacterium phosphoreum]|uniref:phage integrase N-terminal SAM-like domain-containing protein n=1 Tax=Photobacterium phosphoreum TaxID=659 RepID=UPI000CF3E036|nr:hypothetical protein [Photobacterium phosphoreum]MCD9483211.1 hypothetical protein [Photobacterium phosphoreum]MCD9509668.1 hypothetical protein [Photobacterium phosphoreum]PSU35295.1 hypothetical protein CTM85_17665 [Photobacterium phosphoreum]PSU60052.1 hypothetical protein CTM75_15255 [Photobacterium phosphoreum]